MPHVVQKIQKAWRHWVARRSGPLLWYRTESNNPYDFYSSDPVTEIPNTDFISFVDGGKGYAMDIKSAMSLIRHAKENGEPPLNPFNRAPLPSVFLRRLARWPTVGWEGLKAVSDAQAHTLAVTDLFRSIEDLGYYTDPSWFLDLDRVGLQRLYIELADIWRHRAMLTPADHKRICPPEGKPFMLSVIAVLNANKKAVEVYLMRTCKSLITSAAARADRQLGIMYVLGALSIVSSGARLAYPWLFDMFSPGVTRAVNGDVVLAHPSVMNY
jgi:hypothetical protein